MMKNIKMKYIEKKFIKRQIVPLNKRAYSLRHFALGMMILLQVVFVTGCSEEKDLNSQTDTATVIIDEPVAQEKALEDSAVEEKFLQDDVQAPSAEIRDDWTWSRDGNMTVIKGAVKNTGQVPLAFFRVRAEYIDADGNVMDSDSMAHGEPVLAGNQKMFSIMKAYDASFSSVRIWIDALKAAERPIVEIDTNIQLEIVEGWTWTVDGAYTYIKGSVLNTGSRPVTYYKIAAEYADALGNVLDTDFTNSATRIEPGAQAKFSIMHPHNTDFAQVTIYISKLQ